MSGSQFSFLEVEFVEQFEAAEKGERYALSDPRTAMIHARRALESGVKWVYSHDRALPQPYDSKLNTLLNELAFKELGGGHVFSVSKKIQLAGNKAVHEAKPPSELDAVEVMSSLFRFCLWLAVTYGRDAKPDPGLTFNPHGLMDHGKAEKASLAERQELEEQLGREAEAAELERQRVAELTQTVEVAVDDRYFCSKADGHFGSLRTDDAAADDDGPVRTPRQRQSAVAVDHPFAIKAGNRRPGRTRSGGNADFIRPAHRRLGSGNLNLLPVPDQSAAGPDRSAMAMPQWTAIWSSSGRCARSLRPSR